MIHKLPITLHMLQNAACDQVRPGKSHGSYVRSVDLAPLTFPGRCALGRTTWRQDAHQDRLVLCVPSPGAWKVSWIRGGVGTGVIPKLGKVWVFWVGETQSRSGGWRWITDEGVNSELRINPLIMAQAPLGSKECLDPLPFKWRPVLTSSVEMPKDSIKLESSPEDMAFVRSCHTGWDVESCCWGATKTSWIILGIVEVLWLYMALWYFPPALLTGMPSQVAWKYTNFCPLHFEVPLRPLFGKKNDEFMKYQKKHHRCFRYLEIHFIVIFTIDFPEDLLQSLDLAARL